jgi:hypothetical protein
MGYDVYDRDTANLVESFHTEEEALALVRRAIKRAGTAAVASWVLGPNDHDDEVLEGQLLIERAEHAHV